MGFWHSLMLAFRPPVLQDPDFGKLTYMHISNHPEKSYWEAGEWMFPGLDYGIGISLQGSEAGPEPRCRQFYLALPEKFDRILEWTRPRLEEVFRERLETPLPQDLLSVVKLAGFDVENPAAKPLEWEISFETTGEKWLGIIIPFIDEVAQEATVDT